MNQDRETKAKTRGKPTPPTTTFKNKPQTLFFRVRANPGESFLLHRLWDGGFFLVSAAFLPKRSPPSTHNKNFQSGRKKPR